jgi:hypothetical protein
MSRGFKVSVLGLVAAFVLICVIVPKIPDYDAGIVAHANNSMPLVSTAEQKAKGAKCGKTLSKGHTFWINMQQSGDYVVVLTSPDFHEMTYDNREAFTALVVCYYSEGRMDDTIKTVDFRDSYTRANFGYWDKGKGLKFDR